MEISSNHEEEDAEIPMPINSSLIGVHAHAHAHVHHGHIQHGHITHHPYHHHHNTSSSPPLNNPNGGTNATIMDDDQHHQKHHHNTNGNNHDDDNHDDDDDDDDDHDDYGSKTKKMVTIRYKECQKNHAASMGGNATDGCGEFMPSGEQGTIESLTCSACNCHRNFHRKEIQGEKSHFYPSTLHHHLLNTRGRNVILGSNPNNTNSLVYPTNVGPIVPYSSRYTLSEQSDYHHYGNNSGGLMMNMMVRPHNHHNDDHNQVVKKRFRTKFSQEQKEKMLEFAEKVGWKIQRQEESVVQQFCAEVGVKRRVLKVWMHNNKYNLAKKNYDNIENNIINHSS